MKKYISSNIKYKLIGIATFIMLWQVLSIVIGENTFIFPGPIATIKQAIELLKDSYIYKCIYQTMIRMIGGFALSFIIAFILGVFAGNSEKIEEILKPTVKILRSVPTACMVYLFLVIAGARLTPLYIVVLICFPILYESVLGGIKSTSKQILKACRLDGANRIIENIEIRIPLAIPYILVGIMSSFGLSLKIEIMAEVITGYTRLGLGSAILAAQRSDPTNMVPVFGYSFVAIVIIFAVEEISEIIVNTYSRYFNGFM